MRRLAYPLRYLSLVMGGRRFPTALPTIAFALLLAAPYVIAGNANFFHSGGLLDKILTFTSCLTGFYIAGLVAAATYSHPDLDKVIRVGAIYLIEKDIDGSKVEEHLTRREFVCCLFGYLSFSSFAISLGSSYFVSLSGPDWPNLTNALGMKMGVGSSYLVIRDAMILGWSMVISHLTTTTCIGLYYMMDRLHRHDRKVGPPKADKAA